MSHRKSPPSDKVYGSTTCRAACYALARWLGEDGVSRDVEPVDLPERLGSSPHYADDLARLKAAVSCSAY